MVEVPSLGNLLPMKLPFLRKVVPLFLALPTMLQPALAWESGYWKGGYWCSQENNYCGQTSWGNGHNHDRDWSSPNDYYHQPMLESIEYNGRIIRTGIRPRTDICSLVRAILGHCDGYIGFDESRRTHIFRNYPRQQYYQNNQWGNIPFDRRRPWVRQSTPNWNGGGRCVYQDKNIRVLCN